MGVSMEVYDEHFLLITYCWSRFFPNLMDVILALQTKTPWAVTIPILEMRQLTQDF